MTHLAGVQQRNPTARNDTLLHRCLRRKTAVSEADMQTTHCASNLRGAERVLHAVFGLSNFDVRGPTDLITATLTVNTDKVLVLSAMALINDPPP